VKLAEDVFEGVDRSNRKLDDFEDRLNHLREWVENLSKCSDKINLQEPNSSNNPGLVYRSDLMQFEKKLNAKILESLDETNSIMKKMKIQYKELAQKIKHLEREDTMPRQRELKKESSKKKVKDYKSQDKIKTNNTISGNSSLTKVENFSYSSKRPYNSSDRLVQNIGTKFEATKKTSEVVTTFAVPKSERSTAEKAPVDTSKDTREEQNSITLKRFQEPIQNSKEFTDFMTFEDHNSSDIFELSECDTSKNYLSKSRKSKKRGSSRKSLRKESVENGHPNVIGEKRSRIHEFESLRKKGNDWLPKNFRSRSNSKSTKGSRRGSKKKQKSNRKSKVSSSRGKI
jgi:hypothetical protein